MLSAKYLRKGEANALFSLELKHLKLLNFLRDLRLKPQVQISLMDFILGNKLYKIGI